LEFKNYYSTLGVSRSASPDDIQKAYRKMARKYHPDVNRNAQAGDKFKEISEAYEVLKDDKKRATYDRYGSAWKDAARAGGAPPPGFDFHFGQGGGGFSGGSGFSDFFEMLFGGGRGGRGGGSPFGAGSPFSGFGDSGGQAQGGFSTGGRNPRGQDQEAKIALTLEEAAAGGQREITVSDVVGRSRTYSVSIPPGVKQGQKIRLQGRGGGAGGPAGDLYLEVDLKPHEGFRLDGADLHAPLPVTPWEAALGAELAVRTLDGSIQVRIPPGTSSGRKIRLRGKGFPARGGTGDLYAEIQVMVPKRLTPREKELFEELAETSSFKAR
jgi:curved DNA-binding protein